MKTLLIDGMNLIYRGHYVSKLYNSKGQRVSAIHNSLRMIQFLLKKFEPARLCFVWDGGRSTERLQVYPEYKANRKAQRDEETVEEIKFQTLELKRILGFLPVKQIELPNVEADDIIGYLAEKLKGIRIIISNDSDFFQCVKKNVYLFLPTKPKLITYKNIGKHLGFPSKHYILWKSMVGDSSDNIKGIHGIGPKKATNIINTIIKNKKKLPINQEEMEILNRNKYLIAVAAMLTTSQEKNIKLQWKLNKGGEDYERVKAIYRKHDFKESLNYFWQFEKQLKKLG